MFNLALFVHGAEAALAIGFIFAVHFFNGHLRPGKYPMDLVIFTGSLGEPTCGTSERRRTNPWFASARSNRSSSWRRLRAFSDARAWWEQPA